MACTPITFLLVEDDDDHAALIRRHLKRAAASALLYRTKDGEEAMNFLQGRGDFHDVPRPDIVLLDVNLPRYSGHEVLERMKNDGDLKTIPVIMLTTSASETDRIKAYELQANSYLIKPLEYDQFSKMITDLGHYWGELNAPPCDD